MTVRRERGFEPRGRYEAERSEQLYRRALDVIPGGVNSPVRAMRSVGRDPLFIERGEGCELVDVDGNRYVDYVCSWGAMIHGHAASAITDPVAEATERGTSFGAPTEAEVRLAETVAERVPSVQSLRLTNSGTEAAMSAVRLARAATSRQTIVKFAGHYHGHADALLAEAGSGMATQGLPASPGVTEGQTRDTIVVAWNDRTAVEQVVDEHEPAAILCEPVAGNMGVVPPAGDFLALLRDLADRSGALLVFDEVMTGFRVGAGGMQDACGVTPDLSCLGKVLGGGLPLGAFGGPRQVMDRLAPVGPVYQASTLAGNPLAVHAGLAALEGLDGEAYERLELLTRRLAQGLEQVARRTGVALEVGWACGMLTPFFAEARVEDFAAAQATDTEAYGRFCRALLLRGVYPPPSPFEAWFLSLAHDDETIDRTLEAAEGALSELAG